MFGALIDKIEVFISVLVEDHRPTQKSDDSTLGREARTNSNEGDNVKDDVMASCLIIKEWEFLSWRPCNNVGRRI